MRQPGKMQDHYVKLELGLDNHFTTARFLIK